jgi:UDP-glucuronate decarboxylase
MPLPQDDPKQRRPDIPLARTSLERQPTVALREKLQQTIRHRMPTSAEPTVHAIRNSVEAALIQP